MRKLVASLQTFRQIVAGAVVVVLSSCHQSSISPQSDIAAAQSEVRQMLGNPDAGRFRNEIVIGDGSSRIVCGEVNGVNISGAYVGFRPYAYSPELKKAVVYTRMNPKSAEETAIAEPVLPSACLH